MFLILDLNIDRSMFDVQLKPVWCDVELDVLAFVERNLIQKIHVWSLEGSRFVHHRRFARSRR